MAMKNERSYYEPLKKALQSHLEAWRQSQVLGEDMKAIEIHLEITANKRFSNKLKAQIPSNRDLIFHFLKEAAPDITGFIAVPYTAYFLVVEFKNEQLKLDDIYQTRKYAELFDARYALLVGTEEIPEEIKRLCKVVPFLLTRPNSYKPVTLVRYDETTNSLVDWYPENPFAKPQSTNIPI
jgi:hypothetical protein